MPVVPTSGVMPPSTIFTDPQITVDNSGRIRSIEEGAGGGGVNSVTSGNPDTIIIGGAPADPTVAANTALVTTVVSTNPMLLIIGDLSFYHDMNALLAAKQYKLNATIILVNNNGGGIFSFLEQSNYPEFFEQYIATPHGLQFEATGNLYGLPHYKISTWADFREKVSHSIASNGTQILEITGDRDLNYSTHKYLWKIVNKISNNIRATQ